MIVGIVFFKISPILGKTKPVVQVLVDNNFRGDENQVLGIQDALRNSSIEFKNSSYKEFNLTKSKKELGVLTLLLSGTTGLQFIKDNIQSFSKEDILIWSGHQPFKDLFPISNKISVIFLPKHAVSEHDRFILNGKTKLILLDGVPHRIMKSTLNEAREQYESNHGRFPSDAHKLTAIILPGDAPDENGVMKFFTPDDARTLARNIVKEEGIHQHLLVSNGPRTGSHDYQTGAKLNPSPHHVQIIDSVSAAFLDELKKLKISKIDFLDFQFSNLPSAYQALLSLATRGMKIHIPGESTSMVTEATDVAENICIDIVPSMNASHHSQVAALQESGLAAILSWDGKMSREKMKSTPKTTSAELAARFLVDFLQ